MTRTSSLAWVLLVLCLSWPALAGEPTSIPRATTAQVHQTVDRAIKYLQAESTAWLSTRKCAACHHVPMPLWALVESERQGYTIDKKYLTDSFESLLGSKDKLLSTRIFPNPNDPPDTRPQARGLNMGLPFLAVAAQSLPSLTEGQKQSLKLIAEEIVKKQQADGSWEWFKGLRRPPINESQTTDAAWIIMALEGQTGTDAFATGQTLYVLSLAGFTADRNEIKRGIDFLVATQEKDGTWPMISRSTPNGEPGSSKLLSPIVCTAGSWATLALVKLVPKDSPARNAQKAEVLPLPRTWPGRDRTFPYA